MYNSYWPNAIIYRKDRKYPLHSFTYESCNTLDEALKVIEAWKSTGTIISAWVTENNSDRIVYHKCFVDPLGNLLN